MGMTIFDESGDPILIDIEKVHGKDEYETRRMMLRLLAYNSALKEVYLKPADSESLTIKASEYLSLTYNNLYDSFMDDIRELKKCCDAGAYKATLIMAGSVLEGFLLDWLSEIDGKNYFIHPYKTEIQTEDGRIKYKTDEKLITYIDRIEEIERPDWMESGQKAREIQQYRNSVHAKVCIKKDLEINEETCRRVILYLTEIINARIEKIRQRLI